MGVTADPRSGVGEDGEWTPVFPGQRPPLRGAVDGRPFEPGHSLSTRHGAYVSDVRLDDDPRVQAYVDFIEATQPVSHPADAGTIWLLARVYVRIHRSGLALDQADEAIADLPAGAYGKGRAWLASLRDDHDRWISRASKLEAELGRTPASRAKLGLHIATAQRSLSVVEYYRQRREAGLPAHDEGDAG